MSGTRVKVIRRDDVTYPVGTQGTIISCEGLNNNINDPEELYYQVQFDTPMDHYDYDCIWYVGGNNICEVRGDNE